MLIKLYKTRDNNNVIGKTLTDEKPIEIKLKRDNEMLNPVLILNSFTDTLFNFNYCYIPDFGRFYFIEKFETISNNVVSISLKVDVLESFKDDILNSLCLVTKKEENLSFYDGGYKTQVKREMDVYKSGVTLSKNYTNVLVTMGLL